MVIESYHKPMYTNKKSDAALCAQVVIIILFAFHSTCEFQPVKTTSETTIKSFEKPQKHFAINGYAWAKQ